MSNQMRAIRDGLDAGIDAVIAAPDHPETGAVIFGLVTLAEANEGGAIFVRIRARDDVLPLRERLRQALVKATAEVLGFKGILSVKFDVDAEQ